MLIYGKHQTRRVPGVYSADGDPHLVQELSHLQSERARCQKQLRETQLQLEEARAAYTELYDLTPLGHLTLDEKGLTRSINQASARMLERDRGKLVGKHFIAWLASDDRPLLLTFLREVFLDREPIAIELRIRTPTGLLRDVCLESTRVEDGSKPFLCHLTMTDISDRRKAFDAANLTERVIESAAEGIMITDEFGVIRSVNPAFEQSTGYSAAEAIGNTPALLRSGRHNEEFYRNMWQRLNQEGKWQGEIWNRHKGGDIYPEWLSITAVKDSRGKASHYVGIFFDAQTEAHILKRLHHLAYYDGLTELPNRRLFLDRLNMSILHARRNMHLLAVMFVDLDHFKQINDTFGHKFGDSLLIAVTERMKKCLRDGDTLARLGGDEFTVLLPDLSEPDDAIHAARKILDICARPLLVEGREIQISASIGISVFPDDAEEADDLLDCADIAMYQIKEAGRNGYWFHRRKAPLSS